MAGVTPTGFVPKTLGELQTAIGTGLRAVFGAAINLDSRSRFGQLRDLVANQLATLWELGETIAGAFDPAGASGVLLDNICALTGTFRRQAFASNVWLDVSGVPSTVLTVGRRVRVNGTAVVFATLVEVTITDANAYVPAVPAVVDDVIKSGGSVWRCLVGGATTSGAPTGIGPTFTDGGGIVWRRIGPGDGAALVHCEATEVGPLQGYAGTVTVIDTPVAGWLAAINFLDATPGALEETDPALRVRRTNEIAAMGSSPLPAVFGRLLKVAGVTTVTVFENTSDTTVDSMTPHTLEAMVEGGTDEAIRAALFNSKAGGIGTCGETSGTVLDAGGNAHQVKFSRPTGIDIYAKVICTVNAGEYPPDGDAQIKAAIVAWGKTLALGRDVVASAVAAQAFKIPGMLDASALISTAPGPTLATTIAISVRQRPVYDTSRIVVVATPGVP